MGSNIICCCSGGNFCVTVTSCYGAAVVGATVSATLSGTTVTCTTDATGTCCLNCANGTWSVTVTYQGVSKTVSEVVSGVTAVTIDMTSALCASLPSTLYCTNSLGTFTLTLTGVGSNLWRSPTTSASVYRTNFSGIRVCPAFIGAPCGAVTGAGCATVFQLSCSNTTGCLALSVSYSAYSCIGGFNSYVDCFVSPSAVAYGSVLNSVNWSTFTSSWTWHTGPTGACSPGALCYGLTNPIGGGTGTVTS